MKIEKYELKILVDQECDPMRKSPARGALMHGVLMQALAAQEHELHKGSMLRPYSQNIIWQAPGSYVWTINLLEEERTQAIRKFLDSRPGNLHVEHYELDLEINSIELKTCSSYSSLFEETLEDLAPKYANFDFLTPLVFKKAGNKSPWPYPEARSILASVLQKWNQFSDSVKFEDPQIIEEAALHISPHSFRIQSQRVEMDGSRFAGAIGSAAFHIEKDELRQIMNLAGRFAEFSGIGAKTAMGLGAVKYQPELAFRKQPTQSPPE